MGGALSSAAAVRSTSTIRKRAEGTRAGRMAEVEGVSPLQLQATSRETRTRESKGQKLRRQAQATREKRLTEDSTVTQSFSFSLSENPSMIISISSGHWCSVERPLLTAEGPLDPSLIERFGRDRPADCIVSADESRAATSSSVSLRLTQLRPVGCIYLRFRVK